MWVWLKCLPFQLCMCMYMCMCVSYPVCLSGVCGRLASISLLQSSTGKQAGWLAAQERKQSLSNNRWRTACAYTAETHI